MSTKYTQTITVSYLMKKSTFCKLKKKKAEKKEKGKRKKKTRLKKFSINLELKIDAISLTV